MAEWYKRRAKKWKEGVAILTHEERGVYDSLIEETYINEYLPYDHDEINFGLCGCPDVETYKRIKRHLIVKGKLRRVRGPNGWRLRCNGISLTLDELSMAHRRASDNGSKGGRGRKKANGNNDPTKAKLFTPESNPGSRPDRPDRKDQTDAGARARLGGPHAHPRGGGIEDYLNSPMAVPTETALVRRGIKALDEVPDGLRAAVERELAKGETTAEAEP